MPNGMTMKIIEAVMPSPYGQKARAAIQLLRALPVAERHSDLPQRGILAESWAEANEFYRVAKRAGVKIQTLKTNGCGWKVWRVE